MTGSISVTAPGGGGNVTSSHATAGDLVRLRSGAARRSVTSPASTSAAAAVRDNPNNRDTAWSRRIPSRPSGTGSDRSPLTASRLGGTGPSGSGVTARQAAGDARCRHDGRPDRVSSRTARSRHRMVRHDIGDVEDREVGCRRAKSRLMKSTTWPRSTPGARNTRSPDVAECAAEHRARARSAHGSDRSFGVIQTIQPTTTRLISGNTQVTPVPMLNAAPPLRVSDEIDGRRRGTAPAHPR